VGVGDRDQVIHALAGADAAFIGAAFETEIGRAKRLPLGGSYRFGKRLAQVAGRVANKPYASRSERDTQVRVVECADAAAAVQAIVSAAQAREGLEKKAPLSQVAVLLRHPYQSVGIENGLLDAGIPYACDGFTSYLLRPEVLLVRGLLAYADDDFKAIESSDTRALVARALLLFGGATLEVRGREAEDPEALLKEACRAVAENPRLLKVFFENQVLRTGSAAACRRLQAAVQAARSHGGGDVLGPMVAALQPQWLAAQVLVQSWRVRQVAGNIAGLAAMARGYGGAHDFFIALNAFELRQRSLKARDSLTLAGIEAAKGLEFDHVLMPYLNAREFAVEGDSTDERNLFYVGITRARNRLTLLHEAGRASRYLVEAGVVAGAGVRP
jgi:DNA helicase-2/ATP-dependent DNA helicase PcrA